MKFSDQLHIYGTINKVDHLIGHWKNSKPLNYRNRKWPLYTEFSVILLLGIPFQAFFDIRMYVDYLDILYERPLTCLLWLEVEFYKIQFHVLLLSCHFEAWPCPFQVLSYWKKNVFFKRWQKKYRNYWVNVMEIGTYCGLKLTYYRAGFPRDIFFWNSNF